MDVKFMGFCPFCSYPPFRGLGGLSSGSLYNILSKIFHYGFSLLQVNNF